MGRDKLQQFLGRLRRRPTVPVDVALRQAQDIAPASTFEALVEQRLDRLEEELRDLKSRLNGLLFAVVGAVITQVVLKLVS